MSETLALVTDIGATHARFGLAKHTQTRWVLQPQSLWVTSVNEHKSPQDALTLYLGQQSAHALGAACVAVAGPVQEGRVALTNGDWSMTRAQISELTSVNNPLLVNDMAAHAAGMMELDPQEFLPIVQADEPGNGSKLVVGVGTGLGMAALIADGSSWIVVPSEGGHIGLPVRDEIDWEIRQAMVKKYRGRVSAEQLLSGQGLVDIFKIMAEKYQSDCGVEIPSEVLALIDDPLTSRSKQGRLAFVALQRFFQILAVYCSDMALALGARGGVYLCGGVLLHLSKHLIISDFASHFCAKVTPEGYGHNMSVKLCLSPQSGLVGAASLLGDRFKVLA